MIPASDWKRLYVALACSCVLHAALVYLPYLGGGTTDYRPAARGRQPARVLSVRILDEVAPAVALAANSVAKTGLPGGELRPAPPPPPKSGLLPLPAQDYYTADKLTKRPRPTTEPDLGTPVSGRTFPSGLVILRLHISEAGEVVSVEVETSDLPDVLSARAAAAFAKLRFEPGEIHGRRVPAFVRVEVTYNDPPPARP